MAAHIDDRQKVTIRRNWLHLKWTYFHKGINSCQTLSIISSYEARFADIQVICEMRKYERVICETSCKKRLIGRPKSAHFADY